MEKLSKNNKYSDIFMDTVILKNFISYIFNYNLEILGILKVSVVAKTLEECDKWEEDIFYYNWETLGIGIGIFYWILT